MPYKDKQKEKEYRKKYYQKNKEKKREQQKEYQKEYRKKNKEKLNKYSLKYYKNHLGRCLENIRNFKRNNPIYFKEYREKNREKLKKKRNKYMKKRMREDKNFNILMRLRNLLGMALKKYSKTGKIMSASKYGINYKAIIEYLKPFPEDLSNYEIDHRKPLCSFNLEDPEEIKKAFAPENHQWLLASENRSKGGKYKII